MQSPFKQLFVRRCVHSLLAAALLVLAACQTTPTEPGDERREDQAQLEQVPELLQRANEAEPTESANLLLDAVDILVANGETVWARNIITGISPSALADEPYARYQLLASQLAVESGYQFTAERHLTDERLEQILPQLPAQLAADLREQRARVFASISDFVASARERARLDELLQQIPGVLPEERDLNHDLLWQTLMQLSHQELNELEQRAVDPTLQGWYSLASISKNHQANLNKQLAMVDHWARNWPEHPASLRLPADLQLLRHLVENQPQQVALLLPLTGKLEQASIAIRDGFMAAYFDAAEKGEQLPVVRVYDTNSMSADQAYTQAVADGAEAVVGPLEKESISELALRPELPVPTLALNYADTPYADQEQLYQFGLAVEDEAQQVAQQAWQDGNRRAMVFAPTSNWGDRSVDTFRETWQELGGDVIQDFRFGGNEDYLGVIASALHITESKQRTRDLQRMLGRNMEFEPRRRQDVDMIFLVAHPQQARQIKPTLAFHYAGDVPVYATSQIFSGQDPASNQDMNGVRFTTLPWFFAGSSPEKQALEKHANTAAAYQRLYALGVDAYHLYPRLRQLREVTQARYYGYTGALSLNPENKIQRQQTWAQFKGGTAKLMPSIEEGDASVRTPRS